MTMLQFARSAPHDEPSAASSRPSASAGATARRPRVCTARRLARDRGRVSLTAIMGPSGSGKSTSMHIPPASTGRPPARVSPAARHHAHERRRADQAAPAQQIGFVFQFFNLLPMLTAEENMLLPLAIAGRKPERASGSRRLLETVGIADRREHRPRSSPAASSSGSPSRGR